MIKDNLENCEQYYSMHKGFKEGFEFIKKYLISPVENGKYELNDDVYVNVTDCELCGGEMMESHKKYIDIQYIVSGKEIMYHTPVDKLTVEKDNSQAKDFISYKTIDDKSILMLSEGEFAIFFDYDGHGPCVKCGDVTKSKKIIVKVKL